MMPKDASFSDSYTSDRCCFSSLSKKKSVARPNFSHRGLDGLHFDSISFIRFEECKYDLYVLEVGLTSVNNMVFMYSWFYISVVLPLPWVLI